MWGNWSRIAKTSRKVKEEELLVDNKDVHRNAGYVDRITGYFAIKPVEKESNRRQMGLN